MTWVLILTMWGGAMAGHAHIHSVDGFRTERACVIAANQWLKVVDKYGRSAVCVFQGEQK